MCPSQNSQSGTCAIYHCFVVLCCVKDTRSATFPHHHGSRVDKALDQCVTTRAPPFLQGPSLRFKRFFVPDWAKKIYAGVFEGAESISGGPRFIGVKFDSTLGSNF